MNLYGLIGYPLGHSFSKKYFTEKFEREGLSGCSFESYPISSIDQFPGLLKDNPSLKGIAVTIPYKEQVLPFITEFSEEVKAIGAANCIKISGDRLTAYNTDITGFQQSFQKKLRTVNKKALVLGTGGASKAVKFVLQKMNIDFLVVSRHPKNEMISYDAIDKKLMSEYNIIINCSPLGTVPDINTCPEIPYQFITKDHYLFDLVYNPSKTLFLQKGEEKGAAIENGYEMLVIQAEENWRLWNS